MHESTNANAHKTHAALASCDAGGVAIADTESGSDVLGTILRRRYEAGQQLRRGICLLNAGRFADAEAAFKIAHEGGCSEQTLPSCLAACLVATGRLEPAAELFEDVMRSHVPGKDAPVPTAVRVRHALALWASGRQSDAIQALRDGIRDDRECAELHFQLGTLLSALDQFEEAEMRFIQAVNIDREHTEASVSLALCRGAGGSATDAVTYLRRAHAQRPFDARIALLLAQAMKAAHEEGIPASWQVVMPGDELERDEHDVDELARIIESDPDFVDAFLSVPVGEVDEHIFVMLLRTLESALARQPEQAELHFHCGRVLDRLGRREDAIVENERAVAIDPQFVRALVELGRLYGRCNRRPEAVSRLERAIAGGAEYADVYYLLGNLHRDEGKITRARSAYRHALLLNDRYDAAETALQQLPA